MFNQTFKKVTDYNYDKHTQGHDLSSPFWFKLSIYSLLTGHIFNDYVNEAVKSTLCVGIPPLPIR